MSALPYGSWPSPVKAADLAGASVSLSFSFAVMDGEDCYFSAPDPTQGGRMRLFRKTPDASPVELLPKRSVRSSINEYGGGDWAASGGIVTYSDWPAGDLRVLSNGEDRLLAASDDTFRYGSQSIFPKDGLVLAVREEHRPNQEAQQAIISVDLVTGEVTVIASGADFYASPTLSATGQLAWVEWDHPNMPWDETSIVVAPLAHPEQRKVVTSWASNVYPQWTPNGSLIYLSDESGYWNFFRWNASGESKALYPKNSDFAAPMWNPNPAPYSVIDDNLIVCKWYENGLAKLGLLSVFDAGSDLAPIRSDTVAIGNTVSAAGTKVVATFGYYDRPNAYVIVDWVRNTQTPIFGHEDTGISQAYVSIAQPISFEGDAGITHAWYYPPKNGDLTGLDDELPPIQVLSHGGPTSYSDPGYSPTIQFWTTRGIGVLDVNYSGSSGYGRDYRNRLKDLWGVLDVYDCENAVKHLIERELADPKRISIKGGSAGGYTTLQGLTTSDVFTAGISLYGIGDLETMVTDTHKFESHYLDGLV
ncbi:MAG: prolyl oligopeptidase family serine peptidase, partial [Propionibacteriaceae bacterium]|nr:prolyl oligopeptidase family serine peptidase [Propionibacteriaceae bacterium]